MLIFVQFNGCFVSIQFMLLLLFFFPFSVKLFFYVDFDVIKNKIFPSLVDHVDCMIPPAVVVTLVVAIIANFLFLDINYCITSGKIIKCCETYAAVFRRRNIKQVVKNELKKYGVYTAVPKKPQHIMCYMLRLS